MLASTAHAQGARPAVDVRQMSALWHHVTAADFNNDLRPDVIAGERGDAADSFGRVVVRLGNGDGTFGAVLASGVSGRPAATGDFNGDNRRDVVVVGDGGAMWILPGRGDGTFDAPRPLDTVADFRFALSGDVDADGILDLVIGYGTTVEVQPGLGDFTFGPRMVLPPGNDSGPSAAVLADLNGDRRLDLAVAQRHGSVVVYLNGGGLLFSAAEVFVADDDIWALAAADLDRDGDLDLVVPHTTRFEASWLEGGIEVLLGRGDGTFAAPVRYGTGLLGPTTVATGDFNRDGIVDVAVGSRSVGWDDLDDYITYCDSVSIFPGRGNGTLAPPAIFRLDNFPVQGASFPKPYVDAHHALLASDVNRDGHLDLVASPGAVILNRPAAANRPPLANAGPDRHVGHDHVAELSAIASDPDWDWLTVEWRFADGSLRARQPVTTLHTFQDQTMTLVVTDGRGGSASDTVVVFGEPESPYWVDILDPRAGQSFPSGGPVDVTWDAYADHPVHHFRVSVSSDDFATSRVLHDSVPAGERGIVWDNAGPAATTWRVRVEALDAGGTVLAVDTSGAFTVRPVADGGLPWPWQAETIGLEAPAGDASHSAGVFTVRGGGPDIWGTRDGFHIVYRRIAGDATFTARVAGLEGPHAWSKAGIMIRSSLDWGSAHHFLLASVSKGLAYQRRPAANGSSLHTSLGSGGAPVRFRIVRSGEQLTLQMAAGGSSSFTTVATTTFGAGPAYIGLAVTSHDETRLATGRFDGVEVVEPAGLPGGWSASDVGAVGAAGSTEYAGGRWTVRGSGADVWGTADEFHFASTRVTGDFDVSTRVLSVEHVSRWTKAGLMIRDGLAPGAAYAFAIATPSTERGVVFQNRLTAGGSSASVGSPVLLAPPVHLRVTRRGEFVTAFYRRTATDDWRLIAGQRMPGLSSTLQVGLAVSSHVDGRLATATFDTLSLRPLPDWQSADVGAVGVPGRTTVDGGTIQMEASGADIWGHADAFRFHYAQADLDRSLTVRVASVEHVHDWTKAGLMIRESLDPGSKHVMIVVSPGRGIAMQYRAADGGPTANAALVAGTPPRWLRLERVGQTFHGWSSHDGASWTRIAMIDVPMRSAVLGGLALTSHSGSTLALAAFDAVSLR